MITLTTDFGSRDPFAGVMKGVMLTINPSLIITDITHGITPHNITEAAIMIEGSYRYFPPKTIHVVVVDPGVGSERRPILVVTDDYYFVGPDNGVFTGILESASETLEVFHITAEHYFLPKKGSTFHGRDVFAPVAAWLSRGINPEVLGELIADYTKIIIPRAVISGQDSIDGEVIYIDRFGNAITNIRTDDLATFFSNKPEGSLRIVMNGKTMDIKNYYAEASDKTPHCVINSNGLLEVFVFMGSAASALNIKVGEHVRVLLS